MPRALLNPPSYVWVFPLLFFSMRGCPDRAFCLLTWTEWRHVVRGYLILFILTPRAIVQGLEKKFPVKIFFSTPPVRSFQHENISSFKILTFHWLKMSFSESCIVWGEQGDMLPVETGTQTPLSEWNDKKALFIYFKSFNHKSFLYLVLNVSFPRLDPVHCPGLLTIWFLFFTVS